MTDLVAVWDVALSDGVHKIEFEHGTTSGKRVVYVDGKVGKHDFVKHDNKAWFCQCSLLISFFSDWLFFIYMVITEYADYNI